MRETRMACDEATAETLVSEALLADYRRDGAVVLRGVFDEAWLAKLAQGVERNLAEPGPDATNHELDGGGGRFFEDYCNWTRIPEYRDFVLNPPAAALAARFMGARRVQIFHEHLLVKEPGTAKETIWHHDMPYYCVTGDQVVSFWMPLDPVPREICPRFLAGSHAWGKLYYPRVFDDGSNYDYRGEGYEPVPEIEPGKHSILSWDLAPGDVLVFHFLTLHGAPGNASSHRRRGFATRWLGDDARFVQRPGRTSPPYPDIGLEDGDRLREDWFPVVWTAAERRDGEGG
ncbi:MAG: phytanoyl-CoA dioxygenase family protein [Kiloniellales bacterium]|nr:phytanoyl-CoA dioxygenase family protein [Kiloniellales bacterium]